MHLNQPAQRKRKISCEDLKMTTSKKHVAIVSADWNAEFRNDKKGWEKVISLDIVTIIGLNLEVALVRRCFCVMYKILAGL